MALAALQGQLGPKRAAHLLRRATFGPTKEQIQLFAGLNAQQAVERLFVSDLPDPELPLDPATGQEWFISGATNANSGGMDLIRFFKGWCLGQMMRTDVANIEAYSTREKLVFFYHTHFTTKETVVNNSRSLYFQNELFRRFAFDGLADETNGEVNFKALTRKICIDNAMLRFLDGRLNLRGNPNENFARELLELYTIGRGLEGTLPETSEPGDYILFTEQDVQQAALVLTGWDTDENFETLDEETGLPRGVLRGGDENGNQHNNEVKTFSDRFNGATIQPNEALLLNGNATYESALDEITQLIDMIYASNETALHICRKLYRYYVYHEITQELSDTVITEMANTFVSSGYQIQAVLEELFQSRHFFDAEDGFDDNNFGGLIKSPLDLTIGTIRFFETETPDATADPEGFYNFTDGILRAMEEQGMNFYEPFEVAGYAAYHQFPIYNRNWISTNYLARRYDFIRSFLPTMAVEMPEMVSIDALDYTRNRFSDDAQDARNLLIEYTSFLLPNFENIDFDAAEGEVTAERLNYFLFAFLRDPQIDEDPEAAWTFRWNNGVDDEVIQNQLVSLLNAIMQSPEYQLM